MSDTRDRDKLMDALLGRSLGRPDVQPPSGACLDAERAAAWFEGGLGAAERTSLEAHVADCARCQALLGSLARTADIASTAAVRPSSGPRWRTWFIPLAAAAAIVIAVLVTRPGDVREDAARPIDVVSAKPGAPPPAPAGAAEPEARARVNQVAPPEAARLADQTVGLALPRQPAAAPVEAAQEAVAAGMEFVVETPEAEVQWRVREGDVERTTDGGSNWTAARVEAADALLAGSAPSATVCWLVGRGGLVVRTTDGLVWQHLSFPEAADLVSIVATDARTAAVTAADGRVFHTADGGSTWERRPLQENGTAPF